MALLERFRRNLDAIRGLVFSPGGTTNSVLNPETAVSELKNHYSPELKHMIEEAERQGREVGVMLCQTPTGEIRLSHPSWGQRSNVTVTDCQGMMPAGSFHVHLRGVDVFSPPDLDVAISKEQLSCVGYMKGGVPMMKCIVPGKYYEYPISERMNIRNQLHQARMDILRLKRMMPTGYSSLNLCSISPGEEAVSALTSVEHKLGAHEVTL